MTRCCCATQTALADGITTHYVNWVVYNSEGGYLGSGARTPPGFIFTQAGPPSTRKPVTDLTGTGGQVLGLSAVTQSRAVSAACRQLAVLLSP